MSHCLTLKKSNCQHCHKCIRHCPVKAIRFSGNQAHIIGNECILCGQCFVVCPQNAKQIVDETEKVKVLLAGSDPVYVSLAPSYIANYGGVGIAAMEKALKQLGFAAVEETAIGATIVKKEYERMLEEDDRDVIISSCCHSINLLIQKHYPAALPYLADVLSPMQAHCQDIKRRHPEAKCVFIGPCVAKKDEAAYYDGLTDAVLTFEELTEWFRAENIVLEAEPDKEECSRARFFPTTGGILKTMDKDESRFTYLALDGVENCINALKDIEAGKLHHCFIEMSACVGSCIGGPVMNKQAASSPVTDYVAVASTAGTKDFLVAQPTPAQLAKAFIPIEHKLPMPTEMEISSTLRQMGKFTPEQELNCGSCGYNTCREKAIAIIQGKAEISMCLPFLMDKAESFSDTVVKNTPDGLIVLNEKLEVQQINDAAMELMNLRSPKDVLGDHVVRILDPQPFTDVLNTWQNVRNQKVYLADYKRYVKQSIVYDRESHLIIAVLRDITESQTEKEKREMLRSRTIEIADRVVDKQMRIVQEIASLLGETAAETKIALTKLKESMSDE